MRIALHPMGDGMVTLFARELPDFFDPVSGRKMRLRGEPQGKNRRKWGTHDGVQGKLLPLRVPLFLVPMFSRSPFPVPRSPFSAPSVPRLPLFSAPQDGKVKWGRTFRQEWREFGGAGSIRAGGGIFMRTGFPRRGRGIFARAYFLRRGGEVNFS